MTYGILIAICIVALIAVACNLKVLANNSNTALRLIVTALIVFTATRYITLIVYGDNPQYELLDRLRYFYFASSIGITISTISAVWYVTPYYRENIHYPGLLIFFIPWMLFYLYIIIAQPTEIVRGSYYGYELMLKEPFPRYLSIAQGSIVVITIILCLVGIIKHKHTAIRIQLLFIILAQVLLTLDGISTSRMGERIFPEFTLTEAFALFAICYAFNSTITLRKSK